MTRTHGAFCTVAEYERLLEVDQRSPHQEAEIARLTRERNDLRKGLNDVLALDPIERLSGSTNWLRTCQEMRTIAVDALANADKETGG